MPSTTPVDAGRPAGERCGSVTCEHGYCVRDADVTPFCRCDPGYGGEDCSTCVVYVDAVSGCRVDCGRTWSSALRDLQEGIERAAERGSCEVWVADGTYRPTTGTERSDSFYMREHVAMYGGFEGGERSREGRDIASQPTTLSGDIGVEGESSDNSYHVLRGADDAILNGFRIVGGQANGDEDDGHMQGGGMLNLLASPRIEDCEFAFNAATQYGGAIYGGATKIVRSRFVNNVSGEEGGAMMTIGGSPEIVDSVFELNNSQVGGALSNYGATTRIHESMFRRNSADSGGAIANHRSELLIEQSTFEHNGSSGDGGAIYTHYSEGVFLSGCLFAGNRADRNGGALYNESGGVRVTNSVFVGNVAERSGAISNRYGTLELVNSTLVANLAQLDAGGLIHVYSSREPRAGASVVNSILWGNVPAQIISFGEVSEVTYSVVQGGCVATGDETACTTDDTGNRDEDPRFVSAPIVHDGMLESDYDLRLGNGSSCIDGARTEAAPATDLEGNARVRQADIGAYEYPH